MADCLLRELIRLTSCLSDKIISFYASKRNKAYSQM